MTVPLFQTDEAVADAQPTKFNGIHAGVLYAFGENADHNSANATGRWYPVI